MCASLKGYRGFIGWNVDEGCRSQVNIQFCVYGQGHTVRLGVQSKVPTKFMSSRRTWKSTNSTTAAIQTCEKQFPVGYICTNLGTLILLDGTACEVIAVFNKMTESKFTLVLAST